MSTHEMNTNEAAEVIYNCLIENRNDFDEIADIIAKKFFESGINLVMDDPEGMKGHPFEYVRNFMGSWLDSSIDGFGGEIKERFLTLTRKAKLKSINIEVEY